MNKQEILTNAFLFMDRMDSNGSWHELVADAKAGNEIACDEIQYTLDTMEEWYSELESGDQYKEELKRQIEMLSKVK